jgi:hypothetical protein
MAQMQSTMPQQSETVLRSLLARRCTQDIETGMTTNREHVYCNSIWPNGGLHAVHKQRCLPHQTQPLTVW